MLLPPDNPPHPTTNNNERCQHRNKLLPPSSSVRPSFGVILHLTAYYPGLVECKQQTPQNAPNGVTCPSDADPQTKLSLPAWANTYAFTGSLRPTRPITNPSVRKPDYASHFSGVLESEQKDRASNNNIRIYGPEELEGEYYLRNACKMGREVLDLGGKACWVGVTTDEIDRVARQAFMERDCYPRLVKW